jgi:CRP-like cAMP-binding protein
MNGTIEFTVKHSVVGHVNNGATFGDLALLYDCPRAATCTAIDKCVLWRVDQKSFRQIIANGRLHRDQEIINVLRKVSFLSEVSTEYLGKIAGMVTTKYCRKGDVIIKKGDSGKEFYILKQGSVIVRNIEAGGGVFSDQIYKQGDFFGERSIMTDEPRAANVIAREDCVMLCLSRADFLQIVGPLDKLVKKSHELMILVSDSGSSCLLFYVIASSLQKWYH